MVLMDVFMWLATLVFGGYAWYLACRGKTTIEFWAGVGSGNDTFNFGFDSKRDCLFMIFGTRKILRILSPSLRSLPFTGLEWAFLLDQEGYTQRGEKRKDIEMQDKPLLSE
jgi:hypothetical protein